MVRSSYPTLPWRVVCTVTEGVTRHSLNLDVRDYIYNRPRRLMIFVTDSGVFAVHYRDLCWDATTLWIRAEVKLFGCVVRGWHILCLNEISVAR